MVRGARIAAVAALAVVASCNAIAGLNEAYPLACANGQIDVDNDETDKDCGGRICPVRCAAYQACHIDADCGDGLLCTMATCFPDHCANGVADAQESDVDCGASICPPCADGKRCQKNSDCTTEVCGNDARCVSLDVLCSDGETDGSESDVDCGGQCPSRCATGFFCNMPADCESGSCVAGFCI